MSTAIAKNFQVGSDGTATNNFTIRQPATPDGTVRIANGNSGTTTDLVTVTSAGNVGVGTSSPAYAIHAAGNVNGNVTVASNNTSSGTSAFSRFLALADAGNAQFGMTSSAYTDITGATDALLLNANNASGGMAFALDGVLRMKLDSSGNLGLGGTPSAWISSGKAIDIGGFGSVAQTSSGSLASTFNAYQNSAGNWIYKTTNAAAQYQCGLAGLGQHAWYVAPSGTAGNAISFTQAMTLTAGGDLGVGTSSPGAKLEVNGSLRANSSLSAGGVFIVASGSFNNSSVNNIGVFSESHIIIHIATGSNKLSSIPVYPNGGAGIAYVYNYMNPATAAWTNTGGSDLNFTFSCAGSSANTYNVILTSGSGTLTVQRTAGSAAYAVYVQRIASL